MIDFRYHLVSLISVFLALAVGIVLGAGPLREGISETLTGQVAELRTDRDRLRVELELSQQMSEGRGAVITAARPEVVAGTLTGQKVALITLPGAGETDDLQLALEEAGASVVAAAAVSDAIVDPDTASFRSSFAGQLTGYMDPTPAGDASTETILGQALGQGLLGGKDAGTLTEFLTSSDPAFVTLDQDPSEAATAFLIVGPDHAEKTGDDVAPAKAQADAMARVVQGVREAAPAVLAGSSTAAYDLVSVVCGGSQAETVPTVDSVAGPVAAINAPRALAGAIEDKVGHYGIEQGASDALAPHVVAKEPQAEDSADEAAADDEDQ